MQLPKAALLGSALAVLAPSAYAQGYQCPLMMPDELTALEFAYGVQNWLSMFYSSMGDYSADDFAGFPKAEMMQSNGESLAANLATNMAGLTTQAQLGVEALTELAGGQELSSSCDFTYPPGLDFSAMNFFQSSYFIEATLCGTFIGLADYVQSPAAAFLMARLAAEHGIHASYLGSYINPTPFDAMSMALTPAFTPEHVLMTGDGTATRPNVGYLGQWIPQGCLPVPEAPCGVDVMIGNLTASLSGGDVPTAVTTILFSTSVDFSTSGISYLTAPTNTPEYSPYVPVLPTVTTTDTASYTPYIPVLPTPTETIIASPSSMGESEYDSYLTIQTTPAGFTSSSIQTSIFGVTSGAASAYDSYSTAIPVASTTDYALVPNPASSAASDMASASGEGTQYISYFSSVTPGYPTAVPYPASTVTGAYSYNSSAPEAATSYTGPVASVSRAAAVGDKVPASMMAGVLGALLAALF